MNHQVCYVENQLGNLAAGFQVKKLETHQWDNTVTPGEELSVNTDRFLRNFGPIHTDGRRPEVCID